MPTNPKLDRLKSQLLTSGLSGKDQPLYQVINTLIDTTRDIEESITNVLASLGAGKVDGPAISDDNAIARFDGVTGKLLQNSSIFVNDAGILQFLGTTSAFPSLKRSGAKLQLRLADDSDFANFDIGAFQIFNQSGSGNVGIEFIRTGGTALDWIFYGKPGTTSLALYNGTDRFTFDGTGQLTCNALSIISSIDAGTSGGPVSATGIIRFPNNTVGITTRNNANTGDIGVFTTDASDDVILGFLNAANIIFKPTNTESVRITTAGVQLVAANAFYWNARAVMLSPADAQITFSNFGQTSGFGIQMGTADTMIVANKAQNAYGTVDCLGLKASGTPGFNGTVSPVNSITVVNGIVTAAA